MKFAFCKKIFLQHFLVFVVLLSAVGVLSACELSQNYLKPDREGNREVQDYRDALSSRVPSDDMGDSELSSSSALIPDLQPYVAEAGQPMKAMPLVSVSVNQSVPIRDVLFELAEQADYDVELDPRIRGSIIFTARNRPFDQVVARIADIAGLRYKFEDDVLRVELDEPYNKTYKIDYLSYVRKSQGGISANLSVVSGDGADTGSNFSATSESEINFWAELEGALGQILGGESTSALKTKKDPRITATPQNPDVEAVAPTEGGDGQVQVQAPDAVLNVESLPVDGMDDDSNSMNASGGDQGNGYTFGLNKQAGLINVYANEKAQEEVEAYLKLLKKAVTSQVLIEAKVLEVALNDEFATGVNWGALLGGETMFQLATQGSPLAPTPNLAVAFGGQAAGQVITGNQNFAIGYAGNDVNAVIQALSGFGTVKALASPRLTVLNNQSAVLNVSTNQVFFELDVDYSPGEGGSPPTIDVSSELRSVPEGVLVNVQPAINLDDRTVSLALRPTVTRISGEVGDPSVQFAAALASAQVPGLDTSNLVSNIPELNVQEIDSVIQVRSGQPVVLGGLLQDRVQGTKEGVPVLGELPIAGALFRDNRDLVKKTELVIFLKATILDSPSQSVHNTDKDLYREFSSDRRPFKL